MAVLLLCACAIACAGCTKRHPADVILYVSADEYVARAVIAAFEEETGMLVAVVGDTEAKKTTGLVERLRGERAHPQADVFWSSEIFMTIALAEEGLLAPCEEGVIPGWPARWTDSDRRWFGFSARARVIAYAPDRVQEDERPGAWTDLTRDHWHGRLMMADPRFGTTGGHLGAMLEWWDRRVPGMYGAWLEGLADNRIRLTPGGNAGVVRAIIAGEVDAGLTDTDDVWAARAQGHDLAMVYPDHSHEDEPGNGTLLIPNTAALVQGGPNPGAARRLLAFLVSPRTEHQIAGMVSRNVPLGPGLPAGSEDDAIPDPLDIDYTAASRRRSSAVRRALEVLSSAR